MAITGLPVILARGHRCRSIHFPSDTKDGMSYSRWDRKIMFRKDYGKVEIGVCVWW